jgi:hypothetical protein
MPLFSIKKAPTNKSGRSHQSANQQTVKAGIIALK